MDAEEIRSHPAFNGRWFYKLELAPGLYTPGPDRSAIAQTRELLRRVEVEGTRCLDVGTQEAMVPILLNRRGAAEVVAYDIVLPERRLDLVREALGVEFETVGGMGLRDFPQTEPFDVVIFSGVLYHMFDPLSGLATVRGLVRNGGICIVETMVAFDDSLAMHFNAGRYTPQALWLMTPSCLDYLLRWLRLEPLDVVRLGTGDTGRMAVACRAVEEPVGDDEWIVTSQRQKGARAESLDWDAVASDAPPVAYASEGETGDKPLPIKPEMTRLDLAATF